MSFSGDIVINSNGLGYAVESVVELEPASVGKKGQDTLEIKFGFGGGLHLLFSSKPNHVAHLPRYIPDTNPPQPLNMRYVIKWMKENILSERIEMFGDGEGVRPGILVLINDADWELEGELEYELRDRDEIVLISTLHGG
ncbi:uncharacterized protein L203_102885 [Cryptococcus depauperatus CBS 7841]|uniref:Ubiquitin-related modifier 1 n=1 Tax=Cryptococcus depauperatus CBS 7841 TaxID=1295531 RepID=A0A1E3IB02_9TREE|nr:hypothetical protein L203_04689 [Cryptococcus depauperatus CBS 7841]